MFKTLLGLERIVNQAILQTSMNVHHKMRQEKMELVIYAHVHQTGRREVVRLMLKIVQHVRQLIHIRNQSLIWNRVKQVIIRMATVVRSVRQEALVMA